METLKQIDVFTFSDIVNQYKGKQLLIKVETDLMTFSSFGKVDEYVQQYTNNRFTICLDNNSTIKLDLTGAEITLNDEVTWNNTNKIIIEKDSQTITIEYQI